MAKVTRSFGTKARALKWVADMKAKFPGKVIGGSVASLHGTNSIAYVFGDISPEMAEGMRANRRGKPGKFEYVP